MKYRLIILALIAALSAACSTMRGSEMPSEGKYTWSNGAGLGSLSRKVELDVRDGMVSGEGPVNRWSFKITSKEISSIASTRMAGPPEMMNAEHRFFQALEGSTLSVNSTGNLVFVKNNEVVLEFEPS